MLNFSVRMKTGALAATCDVQKIAKNHEIKPGTDVKCQCEERLDLSSNKNQNVFWQGLLPVNFKKFPLVTAESSNSKKSSQFFDSGQCWAVGHTATDKL